MKTVAVYIVQFDNGEYVLDKQFIGDIDNHSPILIHAKKFLSEKDAIEHVETNIETGQYIFQIHKYYCTYGQD